MKQSRSFREKHQRNKTELKLIKEITKESKIKYTQQTNDYQNKSGKENWNTEHVELDWQGKQREQVLELIEYNKINTRN